MARFRYGLQNILDIKNKMETQAKQEFSSAMAALDEENSKMELLQQRKAELDDEAVRLLNGNLDFRDIDDNQLSRMLNDQKIADQRGAIKRAEAVLEKARQNMANAVMERKTYEKLREKAFEEFMQEENRAESKTIDELTSYVYGRKNT